MIFSQILVSRSRPEFLEELVTLRNGNTFLLLRHTRLLPRHTFRGVNLLFVPRWTKRPTTLRPLRPTRLLPRHTGPNREPVCLPFFFLFFITVEPRDG